MFGVYLEGLRQAEDLMQKGKNNEAMHQLNLLEKGVELNEVEKLASMLLTCHIMIKVGDYEKSLMLAKTAFRKSMELNHPLLVVDSTITFMEAVKGLGLLFDSSKKEQKEFNTMISQSEDILKTVKKLPKAGRDLRISSLGDLKGLIEHSQLKTVPAIQKTEIKKIPHIPIDKVKGVGQKGQALRDAGYDNAVDLAFASVNDLVKIKGIGASTAPKLIQAAKELIHSD